MMIIKSGFEIVKHRLNLKHYLASKESVHLGRVLRSLWFSCTDYSICPFLFVFCAQIKFFKFMSSLFTKVAQCSNYIHL